MRKILINFAHPAASRSQMNKALRSAVEDLDGVTLNDLYALYPDFQIDVEREQKLCEEHDVILFQHPFYWYSTPSIMKEWLDLVLQHGWAYGSQGKALHGKYFIQAITAGGDKSTYRREGYNRFTIAELTSPFRATARLCGMLWLPPFMVMGIHRGLAKDKINTYADDYRRSIVALRDDKLDLTKIEDVSFLNSDLDSVIKED